MTQAKLIDFKQYRRRPDVREKRFQKFIKKQSPLFQQNYTQFLQDVMNDPEVQAAFEKIEREQREQP